MNEQAIDRELFEVLSILKCIERKMMEGTIPFDKDIFAIHLAVICGTYDMTEAMEFVKDIYVGDAE